MATVPSKVAARITAGIKQYQPILNAARSRDVNEADTGVIITDMLGDVFGYDKYTEVTSEHAIRGTYCDRAVKIDGKVVLLVEVKAIGSELKDGFIRQATDYAAKEGVDWVILTNGIVWRVYKMLFAKPVEFETVLEFNFCEVSPKSDDNIELLSLISKESWHKARLDEFETKRQALNKFSLAALILGDAVLDVVRRELRRMSPGIKVDSEQISVVLQTEVIKREVLEGEKADAARKFVARAANRALRASTSEKEDGPTAESDVGTANSSE